MSESFFSSFFCCKFFLLTLIHYESCSTIRSFYNIFDRSPLHDTKTFKNQLCRSSKGSWLMLIGWQQIISARYRRRSWDSSEEQSTHGARWAVQDCLFGRRTSSNRTSGHASECWTPGRERCQLPPVTTIIIIFLSLIRVSWQNTHSSKMDLLCKPLICRNQWCYFMHAGTIRDHNTLTWRTISREFSYVHIYSTAFNISLENVSKPGNDNHSVEVWVNYTTKVL